MKKILILIPILIFASFLKAQNEYNPDSIDLDDPKALSMYNKSLAFLDEKIKQDSTYFPAYTYKIQILISLKRYSEAIEISKLLLIKNPDSPVRYFLLGLLYEKVGDSVKANDSYHKAINIFEGRISQGEMIPENEIQLAEAYIMINEEEKGYKLLEKYLFDKEYGIPAKSLYHKNRDEILNQTLQN